MNMKKELFKNGFMSFYQSSDFSDVKLVTPDRNYKCHKIILSFSSEFFRTLLNSNFKESRTSIIELKTKDPRNVFPSILEYMYSGRIHISLENVIPLLEQSDKYLIKDLTSQCKDFITKNIKRNNALQLLIDAIEFDLEEIMNLCLKKIASNFLHMYDYDFSALDPQIFIELLHHDNLAVNNEWLLYKLICRYIKSYKGSLSQEMIYTMMESVRFYFLDFEQIQEVINSNIAPKSLLVEPLMARLQPYECPKGPKIKMDILERRKARGIQFEYEANEDGFPKGIIYWLATNGYQRPWQNPCELGIISVYSSSVERGEPHYLVNQVPQELWTCDVPASWLSIDLKTYKVLPHAYVLRHGGNYKADSLRNWDFQGSNDGVNWTMIKRHSEDESLNGPFAVKTFILDDVLIPYRWFRIIQTGHNSSSRNFLVLSGFELLGELWDLDAWED